MRNDLLHVVGVYSNPRRFAARGRNFRKWIERSLDAGVQLHVGEHAFGERPFELDPSEDWLKHVHVHRFRGGSEYELWLKEGIFKAVIARLPESVRYLCLQDTDVRHLREDWAAETVHMLQHYRVGQTWSHSIDLGPQGEVVTNEWGNDADRSFCAAWLAGHVTVNVNEGYHGEGAAFKVSTALKPQGKMDWRQHYGYSWAIRREVLHWTGLLDWMVTGSADYHMALGFAGLLRHKTEKELSDNQGQLSPGYIRRLREFADKCEAHVRQDIGCVPGTLTHDWHGPKRNRFYISRKQILIESGFDPDKHVAYDFNGIPYLAGDNRLLRDGLRTLAVARNEDSIDY